MEDKKSEYQYQTPPEKALEIPKHDLLPAKQKKWTVIHCPQCNHPTPASNLDLEKLLAKCSHCDAVFTFQEEVQNIKKEVTSPYPVEMPDGIAEMDHGYGKELWCNLKTTMNYKAIAILYAFFVLFCFGFIIWLRFSDKGPILFIDIMFSLFGAGGAVAMVDSFLHASRSTKIKIDDHRLIVEHPGLRSSTSLDIEEIEKVYLSEFHHTDLDGHKKSAFNLICLTKGGDELKLLKNMKLKRQAKYVQQEINKYL